MQFNVKSLSLLLLSTSLMGCMEEAQPITSTPTPTETAPPTMRSSIADNVIRPEVLKQFQEDRETLRPYDRTIPLDMRIQPYENLLTTSTNQQEKDLLGIKIKYFKAADNISSAQSSEAASQAINQLASLTTNEIHSFFQSYIQSLELRSLLMKDYSLSIDRMRAKVALSEDQKVALSEDHKFTREFVAFFENPNLDAQTKAEIEALDHLGLMPKEKIKALKERVQHTAEKQSASLEAPHASPEVSLRQARLGDSKDGGTINTSHLSVNHISGSQARLSVPLHIHLKGTIEGSKQTEDVTGATVYKVNDTLLGLIYGYANTSRTRGMPLKHHETSAVIAHSFGRTYVEAQAGIVSTTFGQRELEGQRYQVSVGHDFERVTPFVQATVRQFNPVQEFAVYAGCEVDIMQLELGQDRLSSNLILKGGYHAFKGVVASIEGSLELKVSGGVTMQTALNLSPWEASTFKIGIAFTQ